MTQNFKLIIEYDGTRYYGWQRQRHEPTIQATIETALAKMTCQTIVLAASGRTDAGVHALGQCASFICATRLTPAEIQKGLNRLLPPDIVIRSCSLAEPQFHARFDAKSKVYRYRINNNPIRSAIGHTYAWWLRHPLDTAAMTVALPHLCGEHDFKAFEGGGSPRPSTVRRVLRAELLTDPPNGLCFEIEANGFLRYMVRNIVGTLVYIGLGKLRADDLAQILSGRDRTRAGPTAPPHGLYLVKVHY